MMSLPRLCLAHYQEAAEAGELFLMYQPKLNLKSSGIDGVEALSRWQYPRKGALEPAKFIRAAELCGAIDWLTHWVLTTAIGQWAKWREEGIDLELAVNVSALNLKHSDFPDIVENLCQAAGMPPHRLTLELTESATQKPVRLMDTVSRLRLKGMGVSLDDFGTGYASMLQLRKLPFTELKIDRSFIADLLTSRDSRAITRFLIGLSHELGLTVTAEGVEDEAILDAVTAFGCDRVQGFLIARPMPADRLGLWLERRQTCNGATGPLAAPRPPVAAGSPE
jgi:EAL domain-containing protein (putative c-di-GMP-specific phosphodiesterase class I)